MPQHIKTYQRMVWKNGHGVTEQIAISPDGASVQDRFLWRLSIAQVSTGGAFSRFVGCDRILVVWRGDGLVLNAEREVLPLVPFHFAGEDSIEAALCAGPIRDFNVIYDRTRVHAECQVHRIGQATLAPGFVFCASGSFCCERLSVSAGETLQSDAPIILDGEAVLIHVCFTSPLDKSARVNRRRSA